jgi:hypothetical protein
MTPTMTYDRAAQPVAGERVARHAVGNPHGVTLGR